MAKLQVHTKFTLRHDDGTSTDYAPGAHEFDDKLADHWYVKLHAKAPETAGAPAPEDSDALGELEADLVEKERSLTGLEAKLKEIAAELEAGTAALDTRAKELDARDEALIARESDLAAKIEAFEAAQRAAAEASADKSNAGQSKQTGRKA
ncbi:hypothetical protein G3N58_17635 [Paraburkholderia sp. Ac-20342]|uniref:STY1053 family phage-associated protein n=1 Tax=Paraburkholderia sp. Ac-20342 TaxID=2703889 RepID=UPI00197CB677|nr:hypothetical protein [Paraburkholderia sp. Ac-20342]MBN3848630.1 hypothetical protein [Paraburkholderia sp. Ac-20342]